MTPLDAALKEIALEFEALRNRVGNGPMPEAIIVRVELDRTTGMPRCVEVQEERKRRILGALVASGRRGLHANPE